MPRTSTLKAGAAALGLLIGFATAPESQVSLDRDVTPYTVAVVWRARAARRSCPPWPGSRRMTGVAAWLRHPARSGPSRRPRLPPPGRSPRRVPRPRQRRLRRRL